MYAYIMVTYLFWGMSNADFTPIHNSSEDYNPISILEFYMELKDAFVESDSNKASTIATKLIDEVRKGKTDLHKRIELDAKMISESSEIEVQRVHFKHLSELMLKISKDVEEIHVFHQFCPMALKNTGASWLSYSSEIRNPYYGNMMLKCGVVKEEIKN